ncbi:ABC-type maltose transport systems, permease component [Fervidobacterium pennivorans DSM 9078]|jgi:maltose/maltodextrin transport system permease protein|uniref:ABC-type maltose transport systems, permease component n=1 Tax=Fervidobacterium pennivorans (strain DSM 9078 / Ven5) TaxID=771875 RepID=H9UC49_FERPD|nr:ABC transporter permease subunit [Fervidobacterium pennivorans]AFG35092.1 ABC-type maltose transport systems, permease component [Fervidobacterium pennivorans DSM 9078]QIV78502.1 ABC transporter permease subunit [Fervidobacterium pennivorans subsp. keratinolyticus]
MVRKERKWLTHIILIIVSIVVLFPIVWVVSTSLRRDNAAFSTKLFSSRMTLQNYIDLIAPEKNGPRLVSDMDALILMAPPHDKITVERAKELFQRDVERFKRYIQETEQLKKEIDNAIAYLNDYFEKNSQTIIKSYIADIDNIIKELQFEKPKKYLEVAAYELYSQGEDLSTIPEVDPYAGQRDWEDMIGKRKMRLEELSSEKMALKNAIEPLEKTYQTYQSQYLSLAKTIRSFLVPQLKEYSLVLKSAVDLLEAAKVSNVLAESLPEEDIILERFKTTLEQIKDVQLSVQKFDDLKDIYEALSEFQDGYNQVMDKWAQATNKDKAPFADFLNTIDVFTTRIASTINETVSLMNRLNNVTGEMLQLQTEITKYKNSYAKIEEEISKTSAELTKAYELLHDSLLYLKAKLAITQLERIKALVANVKLPAQLQMLNIQSKRIFGITTDVASMITDQKKQSKIRKIASKLDWPGTAKDMFTNYNIFLQNYEPFISDLKIYLADIEIQGPKFMPVSKTGVKVRPVAMERLTDTVLSVYRNNVVPNMNVMSRKSSELSDKLNIKELSASLKKLDGAAFRIDQIWQRKPDHYMLRWIMNSVIVSLSVAIIITAVTALAAYPFSRMRFKGRKYGIMALLLIQMFPAIMYMIAIYTFLSFAGKYIPGFGLNKLSGLIFAYLGGIAYNMYLIKGYYDTIPDSLEEAALIDGATRWQTFVKIVLPLASPILAVIVILTFMGTFNEFVLARIILQDVKQYTYAIGLYTFSTGPFETQWGLFTAAAMIGMVPMVILFLLMQKYIVGGLVKGAVKG